MFLTIIITIYLFIHLTFYDAPSDNLWLKFLYIIIPFIPFTILYLPILYIFKPRAMLFLPIFLLAILKVYDITES